MKLPAVSIENRVLSGLCGRRSIHWDVVEINNEQAVRLTFLSVNSSWRQGVWLRSDPGITIDGEMHHSLQLWQDDSPSMVEMMVSAENGRLHVYNIWDSHRGYGLESQSHTSGMLVEQTGKVRTYRCHDIGNNPDFSKLVFSLEFE
jgi:hypothetical protein